MSIAACVKCVNDATVPGIAFDAEGVCCYCTEYEKWRPVLWDRPRLEALWAERVEHYRGRGTGRYDALVGISGGKDSTYVLYKLVKEHGLRTLAFTIDNGFLNDEARRRIASLVAELGVDHRLVELPRAALQAVYSGSIALTAAPCTACAYVTYSCTVALAAKLGIPMAVHGRSRSQMFRYLSETSRDPFLPFVHSALKPVREADPAGACRRAAERIRGSVPREFAEEVGRYFPDLSAELAVEFIPYFIYQPYDEMAIVAFLEEHLNWKRPAGYDLLTHFDCRAHRGAGYLYELAELRPHIMPEASVLVREGQITREEALARLEKERFSEVPSESLAALADFTGIPEARLLAGARKLGAARRIAVEGVGA
jgi:hypothetical protein